MGGVHRYTRGPNQKALHLRWIDDELYQRIYKAAKYRNQTLTRWVSEVLKLYLDGGVSRYVGTCSVCQKRAALTAPVKKGKTKAMMECDREAKSEATSEAARKPTCPHGGFTYHPGCSNPDGSHCHGPWWPAECCSNEECHRPRERTPGNARLEKLRDKMLAESTGL